MSHVPEKLEITRIKLASKVHHPQSTQVGSNYQSQISIGTGFTGIKHQRKTIKSKVKQTPRFKF